MALQQRSAGGERRPLSFNGFHPPKKSSRGQCTRRGSKATLNNYRSSDGRLLFVPTKVMARPGGSINFGRCLSRLRAVARSSDFVAHLEQLDALYGPILWRATKPVMLVEDNGPINISKVSLAAIAARSHWLAVEWLPKYTPELNDIEVVWHDLKAYHLAHQTFTGVTELDQAIHAAVENHNRERMVIPVAKPLISA